MSMVDVIFYKDKIATHNVLEGYKNIINIPSVGEHVVVNENCYKVADRMFDFDMNTVHITLEVCRRRFMR